MSWPSVALSSLGSINTGSTPKTSVAAYWNGDVPFITPSELGSSEPIISGNRSVTSAGVEVSRLAPAGAVLVCCIGSLGKAGIAGRSLVANQQINWIDFDKRQVLPRYGYYACERLGKSLETNAASTTVPIINKSRFSELRIPLPPLKEQQKIVAILDNVDQLRRKRRLANEVLGSLKQSIFVEMFGELGANTKGWSEVRKLGDLTEIVSGITKGRRLNGQITRKVSYLAVSNVQDKFLDMSVVKTIDATEEEIRRYLLKADDLLLTEGGDPDKLGRGTLWANELDESIHQNHIFRVRVNSKEALPLYLIWLLGSSYGKAYFLRSAKQTTGIASINKRQLSEFPTILPPLSLQMEFAKRIDFVSEVAKSQMASEESVEALFSSLQHRAFSGQL